MIALIQRVSHAQVDVGGETVGKCGRGMLILLGVAPNDTSDDVTLLSRKIAALRFFEDESGRMNRSVTDIGGEALVVSQFTLCADLSHGNRPSFTTAAPPDVARTLYEQFVQTMSEALSGRVACGVFGADMQVSLCNDGPVTFRLDSEALKKKK